MPPLDTGQQNQPALLVGTRVARREDDHFLRGRGQFIANLDIPGAAWVTFVTSTAAHARIRGIEVDSARQMPGVIALVTADDLDIGPYPPTDPAYPEAMVRPLLATDTVHYVGEPIV